MHTLTYYQKCYDPDCANFKSSKKGLPINEHFFLNNNIDDDLIATAEDRCLSKTKQPISIDLFSCDIPDEEFYKIDKPCVSCHPQNENLSEQSGFNETFDVEMVTMLNHIEENLLSRKYDDKSEANVFSDEISDADMIALANQCEINLNNSVNDCSIEADLFSNQVDDLLMVSAAEKFDATFLPSKNHRC